MLSKQHKKEVNLFSQPSPTTSAIQGAVLSKSPPPNPQMGIRVEQPDLFPPPDCLPTALHTKNHWEQTQLISMFSSHQIVAHTPKEAPGGATCHHHLVLVAASSPEVSCTHMFPQWCTVGNGLDIYFLLLLLLLFLIGIDGATRELLICCAFVCLFCYFCLFVCFCLRLAL